MFNALRGCWRLLRAVLHGVAGFWTIWWRFPEIDEEERQACVRDWSAQMLTHLGITLVVKGDTTRMGPLLLVSNHISWLDITVIHAVRHCRFVSKSDVKHWPLIGMLASGVGTLFIERESRRDAMRVVHHMATQLREGDVLAIFPEGTTSDGTGMLPFHANLLQAAVSADAPVQPVALTFVDSDSGQTTLAASYVGDDTLVASVWRAVTSAPITAIVTFGDAQKSEGRDRRQWASALREDVARLRGVG